MKNILLSVITLFCSFTAISQSYNCLQQGPVPFYTNGHSYLRAMRIDSVALSGSDSIFYPYRTPRGSEFGILDSTGGSWMGKKVIKHPAFTS